MKRFLAFINESGFPRTIDDEAVPELMAEIKDRIEPISGGYFISSGLYSRNLELMNSPKFAMLGIWLELPNPKFAPHGKIVLGQIFMKEAWKGKGETGPATLVYKELADIAKSWGDGKLHVYSAAEYAKQRRFWDRVQNVVFESNTKFNIGPVYHGTNKVFDKFELKGGVVTTFISSEPVDRHAFFFTDDKGFAGEFGSNVIEARLSAHHVLDMIEPLQQDFDKLVQAGISESWLNHCYSYDTWDLFDGKDGKEFVKALKKSGFDAVMFSESGHTVYAVLDQDQIQIVRSIDESEVLVSGINNYKIIKHHDNI
jgi:hypothetical protein